MSNVQRINASPFDAIRKVRADGSEFWSARDLAPLMGYSAWRNFLVPIERAIQSAKNQGQEKAFVESRKRVSAGAGSTERQDYELTRFAAYLTAMNGDPNKPEVAAAQAYFAIQTHIAETQPVAPAIPQTYAEALREAASQAERAELEQKRAEKAEKKAEILSDFKQSIEGGDGITVSDFGRKYFSEEQYMAVFNHLYANDYLIDQRGTRIGSNGKRKDGYDHMKPKAKGRKYFYLHEKGNHGGKRRSQTRVRPTMELALRDALIADGLVPNTHSTGLVLFDPHNLEELSA